MSQKIFWRGILAGLLSVALATPAGAQTGIVRPPRQEALIGYKGTGPAVAGGAAVGIAGVVAIVTLVLTHKKQITGCVIANDKGMEITDEHSKQTYELLESRAYTRAGERVRLQVKKIKWKGTGAGSAPVWQVEKLIKNYGSCV